MSATYISGSGCLPYLRNGNDSASASKDENDCATLVLRMKVMINI